MALAEWNLDDKRATVALLVGCSLLALLGVNMLLKGEAWTFGTTIRWNIDISLNRRVLTADPDPMLNESHR